MSQDKEIKHSGILKNIRIENINWISGIEERVEATARIRYRGPKVKAVLQAIAILCIVLMMIPYSLHWISLKLFQQLSFWIVCTVAVYTIFSALDYIWAYKRFIRESWAVSR